MKIFWLIKTFYKYLFIYFTDIYSTRTDARIHTQTYGRGKLISRYIQMVSMKTEFTWAVLYNHNVKFISGAEGKLDDA